MQPERLYSKGNKFSKKVMVSSAITWKGVSQPFFIGGNRIKVNGASYLKQLRDDLIPAVEAMYPNKDFTFVQDSASSHRANQVQNFLKQRLKSRFVKNTDWPPKFQSWPPFRLLLLGPRSRENLLQRLMSWRKEFVTFGMSVQWIFPKSAKHWNSFSPIWKLLTQKKVAQSKQSLDRH